MATFLYRIGRSAYLHTWRFLIAWLIIVIGIGLAASTMSTATSTTFSIPGLPSIETQERLQEKFNTGADSSHSMASPTGTLIVQTTDGSALSEKSNAADLTHLLEELRKLDFLTHKEALVSPVLAHQALQTRMPQASDEDYAAVSPLSSDGATGQIPISFSAATSIDIPATDRDTFTTTVKENAGKLTVAWSGNAFQTHSPDMSAEIIGLIVAALVLIITFASLVAAGLPLLTAVIGVACGIGIVMAATAFTDAINSMTPTLASMIGLAVGIDYALFILARYRNELIHHVNGANMTPRELSRAIHNTSQQQRAHLAGLAVAKAGSAVIFAGLTVLIALAALRK